MQPSDSIRVSVTAERKDWRSATASLDDLLDVHWHQPTGALHPLLHAYVFCADVTGDLSHRCDPASAPHRVRVCILKSRNTSAAYAALIRRADEPLRQSSLASIEPTPNPDRPAVMRRAQ